MIPRRLIRSVPAHTTDTVDRWWKTAVDLHPGWDHVTYRDPIDPTEFPITAPVWHRAQNGAQLAGLIRLEALWMTGGIWLDSDVELFRPLDPLLTLSAFAGWEDGTVIPDAVIGAGAWHPAIRACLTLAIERITSDDIDWRTGRGAWATGPGVTTTIFANRTDVTLLTRAAFYPYGYWEKELAGNDFATNPDTYGAHRWHGSWLTP